MNARYTTALIALFAATVFAAPCLADGDPRTDNVPRMLPYQGQLELDGRPVEATGDAALHLLFSLYDGPDAEAPVYSQPLVVEVYAGRFTATIGPVGVGPDGAEQPIDAVVAAADDLYLGMTLMGDPDDPDDDIPLSNRQRIYATPYAMWTTTATNLSVAGRADVAGDATVGGALTVAGDATVGGTLGARDAVIDGEVQVGDGLRVQGPVALPAGSLSLDTLEGGALDAHIRGWVRSHCRVSLGWRDGCSNCGSGPAKHVTVRADGVCTGASGSDTRCRDNNNWGGVNTDGTVDGNDVFYVRLVCD